MSAVPEFGHALLKPLGAPSGKFETFIEVPFKLEGKPVRPDGVIVVTRAGKSWSALLEAKIAAHPLEPDQINAYLDLAENSISRLCCRSRTNTSLRQRSTQSRSTGARSDVPSCTIGPGSIS
jgi:hypothetical protein